MIAYAFRKELSSSWVSALELEVEAGERVTIRVPPLVTRLVPFLTEAERSVATLLIEGKSYLEIAKVRRTSQRTVANQIASLFRRLHISGRAELLVLLMEQANSSVVCGREAHPDLANDDDRSRSKVTARFGARSRSWSSINGSITPSVNPALFADGAGASCR
jgi:DNA-binding CsgD family transcriptional regulator